MEILSMEPQLFTSQDIEESTESPMIKTLLYNSVLQVISMFITKISDTIKEGLPKAQKDLID